MNWQAAVRASLPNFKSRASYAVLLPGVLLRGDSAPKDGLRCLDVSTLSAEETQGGTAPGLWGAGAL